ncbi:unnamed protein product [Prunus armeniaca]|uniref:Uncharacterized protein n=1 Tax=Prunus armeniaca TaxID=36596 RepID=A0A6J5XU00_PRUAR|nr:unnamed protein product [Prunus armeniaca]CAB4316581.1 unnamed protein product [Prunus armeniaca]
MEILLTGKFPYWAGTGRRLKATYNSRSQNNQTHLHPQLGIAQLRKKHDRLSSKNKKRKHALEQSQKGDSRGISKDGPHTNHSFLEWKEERMVVDH